MFEHVLVGYDGSPSAEDALALGRAVARATGARLAVGCGYWYEPLGSRVGRGAGAGGGVMRREAEAILAPLRERLHGEALVRPIAGMSPAAALAALAVDIRADLLVTGSTTRGRFGRATIGSTAERLLHEIHCAVAVAPRGLADLDEVLLRHIGVAYVPTPESADALAVAHALAARTGGDLTLLTAFDQPADVVQGYGTMGMTGSVSVDARTIVQADLDDAVAALPPGVAVHTELIDGEPAAVLRERAMALDVLVMGSRANAPLTRIVLGSVAHDVLRDAPAPVLVVPRGLRPPGADRAPAAGGAAGTAS